MEPDLKYEETRRDIEAASAYYFKKFEDFRKTGIDINSAMLSRTKNETYLHYTYAADMLKLMLAYGGKDQLRKNSGITPLHSAIIQNKEVPVILLLLEFDSNVNAVDKEGRTPLHCSINSRPSTERLIIWKKLLACGAEINTSHINDIPFLHFCSPLCQAIEIDDQFGSKFFLKMSLIINFKRHCTTPFYFNKYTTICKRGSLLLHILTLYQDQCICEIVKMKSHKLYSNCSLFNLIIINNSEFIQPLYSTNKIKRKKILKSYPIYQDVILPSIKLARKRGSILNELKKLVLLRKEFYNTSTRNNEKNVLMSLDCWLLIAKYLTNDDITNYIRAFSKNRNKGKSPQNVPELFCEVLF